MKLFSKVTILTLAIASTMMSFAQKNQNDEFQALSSTNFKEMGGSTYEFRSEVNEVGNVHIYMTETYKSGKVAKERLFIPDHNAFPTHFVEARDRSLGTPLADLKILGTKTQSTDTRIVFLDNSVYFVWYWKSKDSFKLQRVMKAQTSSSGGKKKGGGLKALKAAMAESKKTDEEKLAPLNEYLTAAFAKQDEVKATWEADNKAYIDKKAEHTKIMDEYVNKVNSDYWNSEEGQRKLAEMRQPDIILKNDLGVDVWLCYGSGVSTKLKPGETEDFTCTGGSVYKGTQRANNSLQADYNSSTDKLKFERNGTRCGETINISSVLP